MRRKYFLSFLLVALSLIAGLTSCTQNSFHPKSNADMFKISVEITNYARTSGGSGVVYHSDNSGSLILTNAHVCRVIHKGGLVIDPNHMAHNVSEYKESAKDDICMIKINSNLKIGVELADKIPEMGDEAIAAEHPALMPLIISRGHFGDHEVIEVEDGVHECTDEEKASPLGALFCGLFGKMPNIVEREAQIVSCLIQPGSSGSPVFNSDGELAGLVFAGRGEIGFGYIVPLEALQQFMKDVNHIGWTIAK